MWAKLVPKMASKYFQNIYAMQNNDLCIKYEVTFLRVNLK